MIFHGDMSLRNWYFIRVNRVFEGIFLGNLPLEFLRYLLAVFGVLKVVNLRKENLELIFDLGIFENFFLEKRQKTEKSFSS